MREWPHQIWVAVDARPDTANLPALAHLARRTHTGSSPDDGVTGSYSGPEARFEEVCVEGSLRSGHRQEDCMNLFDPGLLVATPGALAAAETSGESLLEYIQRHLEGDWGDISDPDIYENLYALEHDLRLLSSYKLKNGQRIWIITEADRSSTCVLLPEEY